MYQLYVFLNKISITVSNGQVSTFSSSSINPKFKTNHVVSCNPNPCVETFNKNNDDKVVLTIRGR